MVTHLLQKYSNADLDVNFATYQGRTALHSASSGGCIETIQILLDKGAKINTVDNQGWNCLIHALQAK
jgi:ankyrin repeat protein